MALTKIPASFLDKSSHVDFANNEKLRFGAGADLQIYHDGSNSYVKDAGTGNLNLQGENLALENTSGDNYFVGVNGSFAKIYYSGVEKLATTSSGIDVTGNLAVSGNLTVSGTTTELDTTNLNVTDKNITLNYHASNDTSSNADGAGITIQDAIDASNDATLNWSAANDRFVMSHGLQVTSGNVGIGTASPSVPLSVVGNILSADGSGQSVLLNQTGSMELTRSAGGFIDFKTDSSEDYDCRIKQDSDGIRFHTGGQGSTALAMTITSAGNVGIGTTSPKNLSGQKSLSINASVPRIDFKVGNVFKHAVLAEAEYISIDADSDNSQSNSHIRFAVDNGEKMRIDSSGRVMIGTTTEGRAGEGADMFTIGDTSGNSGMTMRSSTSGYGSIYFSDATSGAAEYAGYLQYGHTNDILHMAVGGSIAMNIKSGMVGIGSNVTPARPLHIVGPDGASGISEGNSRTALFLDNAGATYVNIASANDSAGAIFFSDAAANNRGKVRYHHNNDYMDFDTAGTHRLRIDENGSVSISNDGAVPHTSSKLHVKGSAFTMSDASGNAGGGIQIFNIAKSADNNATAVFKVTRDHGAHAGFAIVTKSVSGDSRSKVFAWAANYNGTPDIQTLAANPGSYTDFTASATLSNEEFTFKLTNGDSNSRSFRVTVIYGGAAALGTPTLY